MLMNYLSLLVLILPLLSAATTHLSAGQPQRRVANISVGMTLMTFLAAAVLLAMAIMGEPRQQIALGQNWGVILFDPLSALMAVVISGISFIVHLYSVRYMAEESGYARFFVMLDCMTAALLIMVAAGDLITLLIAWHLIGVVLYFLLGHDTRSQTAFRYGFWTFITYRIGDIPLVLAAVILFHTFGTWSLPELFDRLAADPHATTFLNLPVAEVVGALVAMAAFARSAQLLLHTWLPYTMEGPTPVSALMHAGIVNSGGFLINRFAPLYIHTGDVLHWVFVVGLATAIIGSVLMLTQNDVKKSLGYSTMGQMGFMIMECGVGAFSLAIFHLIAHGLFKGTMFLSAGGVIGEARRDDGVPKDDLYTFVVERESPKVQQPLLMMVAITLVIPIFVLVLSHWWVSPDLYQKQGAVILLFFGWITGAQLLFSTYHMKAANPWRLLGLIIVSFVIVVVGYTLISHAFDSFLYEDPQLATQLYKAAGIDIVWFDTLVILTTIVVVLGWVRAYRVEKLGSRIDRKPTHWWMNFYSLISREFYIIDFYSGLTRRILAASGRLNVWMRWG
jgi:NADH-quinone oxidoreductase subunit L